MFRAAREVGNLISVPVSRTLWVRDWALTNRDLATVVSSEHIFTSARLPLGLQRFSDGFLYYQLSVLSVLPASGNFLCLGMRYS